MTTQYASDAAALPCPNCRSLGIASIERLAAFAPASFWLDATGAPRIRFDGWVDVGWDSEPVAVACTGCERVFARPSELSGDLAAGDEVSGLVFDDFALPTYEHAPLGLEPIENLRGATPLGCPGCIKTDWLGTLDTVYGYARGLVKTGRQGFFVDWRDSYESNVVWSSQTTRALWCGRCDQELEARDLVAAPEESSQTPEPREQMEIADEDFGARTLRIRFAKEWFPRSYRYLGMVEGGPSYQR
jgi:hypothetical protein